MFIDQCFSLSLHYQLKVNLRSRNIELVQVSREFELAKFESEGLNFSGRIS